jgi:putative effector of murein hydrolase
MAETLGASAGITAMLVILTGVLGAILSPLLSRTFRFEHASVIGIATGCSSHGIGTAALAPRSSTGAAFSGIAFALMAIFSSLLVGQPELRALILSLL